MRSSSAVRRTLLGVVVGAEILWIATQAALEGGSRWIPLVTVVVVHLGLVLWEQRDPLLDPRLVLGASAAVIAVAVLVPPFGSQDLYLYATYGRMVTWHQLNPYLSAPELVSGDVLTGRVADAWRTTPTAYGPFFTAWSALGAVFYGDSPLRARLFFQGSAGVALLAGTWYLHRRGRPSATLVAVGLSPVLVVTAHGGHNDLLAGVLALVGVDFVRRRRTAGGALMVGLACAVKVLLLPVAGVVVLVSVGARRWGEAARSAAVLGGVLGGSYLVVGGPAALAPLRDLNQTLSRGSLWGALTLFPRGDQLLRDDGWAHPLAMVLVVLALGLLAWRAPRPIDVVVLATAMGVVVCFALDYTLPWYAAGFLPLAALAPSVPARALAIGSTALLFVYVQPPGELMADLVMAPTVAPVGGIVLGLLVVATLASVLWSGPRRSPDGPTVPAVPAEPARPARLG